MFEDKTLVCKDCGAEFIFSAGEQEFYAEKASRMSPYAARHAGTLARASATAKRKCMTRYAHSAALPPRFLSFPRTTGPSIAALASRLAGQTTKKRIAFPCKG